jgi:cytochrome P450
MATQIQVGPRTGFDIDPLDVSRPELYADDTWREPFAELRARHPVYHCENSRFGPYWSLSTYKPIIHAESLPKIFSSGWEHGGITILGEGQYDPDQYAIPTPMFIAMDPPKHRDQRRTVAPAFSPSMIDRMTGDTVKRAGDLLDTLPIGQPFDWVDRVSMELTTQMLAILFDFPWEQRRDLTRWSDALGDIETFATQETRAFRHQNMMEMAMSFGALWQEKAKNPGEHDLISIMLRSEAMSHMDQREFIGNLILLIVGGNDTTRNSMSAFAYGLDQFPDERAKLEANHSPELAVNAMHELIRWQTPLAHMRRTLTEDTELEGQKMAKGDKVVLWYLSANRDESVFADPETIIVDRDNARRNLSFGYGIHRCVGARVAEMQLTALIGEMQKRRLRVHVTERPVFVPNAFVHGYRKMMVELERY